MYTIYMCFNGHALEMDTFDSFIESMRRCEIYFSRNPRRYVIQDNIRGNWYEMDGDPIKNFKP